MKKSLQKRAEQTAEQRVTRSAKAERHARGGSSGRAKVERSGAALSSLPTELLAAELARRRSELPRLREEAARLRGQLAALESRIALLSGEEPSATARIVAAPTKIKVAKVAKAPARAGGEPKRGPRTRRDGRPTLAVVIGRILEESREALALREITDRAARALGRAVNPSLLVQTSQTLRKLVVRGAAAQPARGMYLRGSEAPHAAKEETDALEPVPAQD